jgi:hypothetical protein
MAYKLTLHEKATYLHFVVTGKNSIENVMRYMDDIVRECDAQGCNTILIEERLEGPRLKMMEVFDLVLRASKRAAGKMKSMAYVDVNASGDFMQFAETVAVNRMMPMKLFSSVAEAEKWLQENH